MSREEALAKLAECQGNGDIEAAHAKADEVLVMLLSTLGYDDVCDAWDEVHKWYA